MSMPPQSPTPNNQEIDQALKEFQTQSAQPTTPGQVPAAPVPPVITPQAPPDSGIEFETDKLQADRYKAIKLYEESRTPKVVKLVMKASGVGDQKKAEYFLFFVVVVMMGVAVVLFIVATSNKGISSAALEQLKKTPLGQVPAR